MKDLRAGRCVPADEVKNRVCVVEGKKAVIDR